VLGIAESTLSEVIAERVDLQGNPTIAFLARASRGFYVRLTAKAATPAEAQRLIDDEEALLRPILGVHLFGPTTTRWNRSSSTRVRRGLDARDRRVADRRLRRRPCGRRPRCQPHVPRSIAAYATDVKRSVLGVTAEHVVSEESVIQMAVGAQRVLGSDVGLAVTGVAGPDPQDGQPVGTVWLGVAIPGRATEALMLMLPGDRRGSVSSRRSRCWTSRAGASSRCDVPTAVGAPDRVI